MNFENFFSEVAKSSIEIEVDNDLVHMRYSLDNEALFQLPFICMVILMISKGNRKPKVSSIGQTLGECLEKAIPSFKGSSQHLGWSANLRIRTVKALEFLELTGLIKINNRHSKIELTELGKKVINRTLNYADDLAVNLQLIAREYRNICIARQLQMELIS